jgi:hypothetical protein
LNDSAIENVTSSILTIFKVASGIRIEELLMELRESPGGILLADRLVRQGGVGADLSVCPYASY